MDLSVGVRLALSDGPKSDNSDRMSIAFLLTTLVVVALPGTGVVFTLAAGLSGGARASVVAAFGCALGTVPQLIATVCGLAAVLHASTTVFQTVKYAGVAYLVYLAWATFRDKAALVVTDGTAPRSAGRVIGKAILINTLNPKLTLFFVAFLPQFATTVPRMLGLGGVFVLTTFVVFCGYRVCAAAVRGHLLARPRAVRALRGAFAASFFALAARLVT
jgi:threonine/homoserine/homoserine lactone efflux protein